MIKSDTTAIKKQLVKDPRPYGCKAASQAIS